jgi:hypothetical protein
VIAVRIWDQFCAGGLSAGDAKNLQLKSAKGWMKSADMYHPDYREDFGMGDEPTATTTGKDTKESLLSGSDSFL